MDWQSALIALTCTIVPFAIMWVVGVARHKLPEGHYEKKVVYLDGESIAHYAAISEAQRHGHATWVQGDVLVLTDKSIQDPLSEIYSRDLPGPVIDMRTK